MQYLPRLTSGDTEITIEKLDKVAKTLSEKVRNVARLFVVFLGWCIFNTIVALLFNRMRSLSLDSCRLVAEGLHEIAAQDLFYILTLFFENKITCVISIAMILVFGEAFFVRFLNLTNDDVVDERVNKRAKAGQSRAQGEVYVVSYKQQVAFLA